MTELKDYIQHNLRKLHASCMYLLIITSNLESYVGRQCNTWVLVERSMFRDNCQIYEIKGDRISKNKLRSKLGK